MNNIKSFSFYRNYYELIKYLSEEERLKLYDAVMNYVFEDKEPQLENLLNGVWINFKMCLDTSKNNAGRGGRPKKEETEQKPIKNRTKTDSKTDLKTNNISYFLFLISNNKYKYINKDGNVYNKICEWLEYKQERKEKYAETGLKNLLTQIEKQIDLYGEDAICNLIEECMSNNYKGIIFDKLKYDKKIAYQTKPLPNWFNEVGDVINPENKMEEAMKELMQNV